MRKKDALIDKILFLEIILFFILIFLGYKALEKNKPIKKEFNFLKSQIENIKKENKEIEEKIEYLSSDYNLEKEIKKNLGLGYEGENFLIFPESKINQDKNKENNFFKKLIEKIIK